MKALLQITARDVPHSEALESHIRQKAEKLETFYPNIMGCRVVVEVPHKHKHQGRMFNVCLDITVPGKELVVNREADEDVYARCLRCRKAPARRLRAPSARLSRRTRQSCAARW